MARPKKQKIKERVNLTLSQESLEKGKELAKAENKSLSQFIEDMFIILFEDAFGFVKNPFEIIKNMKRRLDSIEKTISKKEGGEGKNKK